jgi:hypothetical protein
MAKLTCGQCRHFEHVEGVRHIFRGLMGKCTLEYLPCQNDRGQYLSPDDNPRLRYERETAGANFAPKESER